METVDQLVHYPLLLLIEYIRASSFLVATLVSLALSFVIPSWHLLRKAFPEVDITVSILHFPTPSDTINALTSLTFMAACFFFWSVFLSKIKLCESVRDILIKSKNKITEEKGPANTGAESAVNL